MFKGAPCPLTTNAMSTTVLAVLVVTPTAAVVIALFMTLWHESDSTRQSYVAIISGIVLSAWAVVAATLAYREYLRPPDAQSVPPIGIFIAVALFGMFLALRFSRSLRSLLANQRNLIWLNVWRLEGILFLILMAQGQMPALWALPAGIGDIIVGVSASWVAMTVNTASGRRRAIVFNFFGLLDLIVAVSLGITTNPGQLNVFHTTPTSELITGFPLALVPAFLVPLAFTLHIISLWQLFGGSWSSSVQRAPVAQPSCHEPKSLTASRGLDEKGKSK